MTSKILLAVFAVLCASSAVQSSAINEALSITPADVLACLLKVLRAVGELVEKLDGLGTSMANTALASASLDRLTAGLEQDIEGLAERAGDVVGPEAAACIEQQRVANLVPILDKLRLQRTECVDDVLETSRWVSTSLENSAEALIADVKVLTAKCPAAGVSSTLCLGKVLISEQTKALSLVATALQRSSSAALHIRRSQTKVTVCVADVTKKARTAARVAIRTAATTCLTADQLELLASQ